MARLQATLANPATMVVLSVPFLAVAIGVGAVVAPKLMVVGVLGLVLTVMMLSNLTLGVAFFTLVTFFQVTPSGAGLTIAKPLGLVLTVSWLGAVLLDWRRIPVFTRDRPDLAALVVLFFSWAVLSAVWAKDVAEAQESAVRLALVIVFLLVVYSAIRTAADLRLIAWAFLVGTALTTVYGFAAGRYVEGRFTGGMSDANFLASALVASFAIAGFLLAVEKRTSLRLLLFGSLGLFVVALVLTQSRGGLVALAVTLVAACFLAGPFRTRALVTALVVVTAGIGFYGLFASAPIRDRATSISGSESAGRSDAWRVALAITADNPVAGVGLNNYPIVQGTYITESVNLETVRLFRKIRLATHNTYLQTLSELGVVGLGLFLALLGVSVTTALTALRSLGDLRTEAVARGLVVGIIGLLVAYVFLSGTFEKQLWLLLGVLAAIPTVVDEVRSSLAPVGHPWGERAARSSGVERVLSGRDPVVPDPRQA